MIAHVLFNLMIHELGKRDKVLVIFFVATSLIKSKIYSSNVIKLYGKISALSSQNHDLVLLLSTILWYSFSSSYLNMYAKRFYGLHS